MFMEELIVYKHVFLVVNSKSVLQSIIALNKNQLRILFYMILNTRMELKRNENKNKLFYAMLLISVVSLRLFERFRFFTISTASMSRAGYIV